MKIAIQAGFSTERNMYINATHTVKIIETRIGKIKFFNEPLHNYFDNSDPLFVLNLF